MAGLDYFCCRLCGERLFYDGDELVRASIEDRGETKGLTCDHCVDKLLKKIEKLKKHDRRNH